MIIRAALFIQLVSRAVNCVHCVHADAALEACRRLLSEETLHLDLLDQIVSALMDVGEAVDLLPGQMRGCSHQIFILRILRQLVCHGKGIQRRTDDRMINRIFNLLAEHPEVQMELSEGLDILVSCHHNAKTLS